MLAHRVHPEDDVERGVSWCVPYHEDGEAKIKLKSARASRRFLCRVNKRPNTGCAYDEAIPFYTLTLVSRVGHADRAHFGDDAMNTVT